MPECKTKSLASGFEVWTPDADDSKLTWSSGVYDDIEAFEQVSRTTVFEHGASFLGRVWQERTPMLFADLFQMEFKRFEAARSAGITSAVAWPIIDGDRVTAVVNILCNHADGATGAFELWKREERAELGLQGEYYANIDQVSTVSQFVKFPSGSGLPGSCWEERSPRLIRGLGRGSGFVRGSEMALSGIELGLAIPVMRSNFDLEAVVLMLSSKATPVARVTEIWRPDAEKEHMVFDCGFHGANDQWQADRASQTFEMGAGAIGQVWETRLPFVDSAADFQAGGGDFSRTLTFPVIAGEELRAIVVLAV